MQLSQDSLQRLLSVSRDARSGLTFSERMEAVSHSLLGLIPGSSLTLIVLDPQRPERGVHSFLSNCDPCGAALYASRYVKSDPLPGFLLRNPDRPQRLSDCLRAQDWGKDAYTGEFLPRERIRYVLGFVSRMLDGRLLQVGIHRERSLGDFNVREANFFKHASRGLGLSTQAVLLREQLSRTRRAPDQEARLGTVVFSALGAVEHANAGAGAILSRLGQRFPMRELVSDIEQARSTGEVERVVSLGDSLLVLRCRPLARRSGTSVLVVLEQRRLASSDDLPTRLTTCGLSGRQIEIAECASRGLSNAQIAQELRIRPATVGAHLTQVFRKTGATDRVSLIRMLNTGP